MEVKVKHKNTLEIIINKEAKDLREAIEISVKEDAYLNGADLRGADLRGADLEDAYLNGADLNGADLNGAYLRGADLRGADLGDAYLSGAYLSGADLSGADLSGADLNGADLSGADLGDVKIPPINDHYFVSEILYRESQTEIQKNFSARIRVELDLCWKDFYKLAQKMKVINWCEKTLSKWDEFKEKIKKVKGG